MPAQIFFKFKSQLKFDSIPFDGLSISAKEVRRSIVAKKKMKIDESDLQLINAASNEEYSLDDALIPENTSLIVVRLPRGSGSGPKVYNPVDKTTTKMSYSASIAQAQAAAQKELAIQAASNPQVKISESIGSMDISKMTGSEEDKIATMQKFSGSDFDPSKYVSMPAKPPPNYICHRCGQPGHFIKYCNYVGPAKVTTIPSVKKATGIPMIHTKPANQDTPGAMLTATGDYVVPIIDSQAISEGKTEKPPFIDNESDEENSQDVDKLTAESSAGASDTPDSYRCQLCEGPYRMAVITPCCGESFCDDCISDRLMKNEKKCYVCASTISVTSLIPNKSLRDAVIKWQNDSGVITSSTSTAKMGTSPGASPHYTPSGNSSPHHGSRTPQKGETAVDPSMNESRSKSLSSRLQVIQEIEQEDGLVSVNPATAAGGEKEVNESSAVAREEGLGSGLIKEMSKTLSDLYGAINWDDVAKTGIKNNSAALATTANNLPYISTNASLTKSQTSSSVPDFLAASSHQATKSPDASNVNNNNNKVRENSEDRESSPAGAEFDTVTKVSPHYQKQKNDDSSATFDPSKLSQSDAELLKSLLLDAKKKEEKEIASKAEKTKSIAQLPFPPPHMMPPGGAAGLWPGNPAAAAMHLNQLLMPSMLPLPIPPAVSSAGAAVSKGSAAGSSDTLLGVPFLKPMSEKEFYARQKQLSKKSGETNIKRLEAKLLEKQLQQLVSSDDSSRGARKMKKLARRRRSPSPRKSRPEKRAHREKSRERRPFQPKHGWPADDKRRGEYKRYEPYPPQSKKHRKQSRSRSGSRTFSKSPKTRSPSPRGLKKPRAAKSPSLTEISDPLEAVLKSARQKVEEMETSSKAGKKKLEEGELESPIVKQRRIKEPRAKSKERRRSLSPKSASNESNDESKTIENVTEEKGEKLDVVSSFSEINKVKSDAKKGENCTRPEGQSESSKPTTPTLDEKPEEAEPVDFSLLASVDLMKFDSEEDRKVAEKFLKEAQIKILEHRKKALIAKQGSSSRDRTPEALEIQEEKKDAEKGNEKENVSRELKEIMVPEAESVVIEETKSKKKKDKKKDKENALGLVQYGSEESENEIDQAKKESKGKEHTSVIKKTPKKSRHSDIEGKTPDKSSKLSYGKENEVLTEKSPIEKPSKVSILKAKLEKIEAKSAEKVFANETTNNEGVNDSESVKSAHDAASHPSDYDHPQLSAEEEFIPGENDGIDDDEQNNSEEKRSSQSPSKKKKRLRVEPPPMVSKTSDRVESSAADSETEGGGQSQDKKKSKKEKKSKEKKKMKERNATSPTAEESVGKKELKTKKKKKKKNKEDKESKKERQRRSSSSDAASREPVSSDPEDGPSPAYDKDEKYSVESRSPSAKRRKADKIVRRRSEDRQYSVERKIKNKERDRYVYRDEEKKGAVSSAVITHTRRHKSDKYRRSHSSDRVGDGRGRERDEVYESVGGNGSRKERVRKERDRDSRSESRSVSRSRSPYEKRSPSKKDKRRAPEQVSPTKSKVTALMPDEQLPPKSRGSKKVSRRDDSDDERDERRGRGDHKKRRTDSPAPQRNNNHTSHYSEISGSESDGASYKSRSISSPDQQTRRHHRRDRGERKSSHSRRPHDRSDYPSKHSGRPRHDDDVYVSSRAPRSPVRDATYHSKKDKRRK